MLGEGNCFKYGAIRIVQPKSLFSFLSKFEVNYVGLVGNMFANDLGDLGSIPGRVIPKTLKNGTWYLLA